MDSWTKAKIQLALARVIKITVTPRYGRRVHKPLFRDPPLSGERYGPLNAGIHEIQSERNDNVTTNFYSGYCKLIMLNENNIVFGLTLTPKTWRKTVIPFRWSSAMSSSRSSSRSPSSSKSSSSSSSTFEDNDAEVDAEDAPFRERSLSPSSPSSELKNCRNWNDR